jgi:hypothetical protein
MADALLPYETEWNIAIIRELIKSSFDDEEITTICYDHFRPVCENLSSGMSKGHKIQQLLEYCDRHDQMEALLSLVEELNPAQYARFESHLHITPSQPRHVPGPGDLRRQLNQSVDKPGLDTLLVRARTLLNEDSLDEAVKLLERACLDYSGNEEVRQLYVEAVYRHGVHLYVAEQKLYQARRAFITVRRLNPDYEDAVPLLHKVEEQIKLEPFVRRSMNQAREILQHPIWEGIGAIVAIVGLVVAIVGLVVTVCAWLWPDIRPLLFHSPTAVAVVSPIPSRVPSPSPTTTPTATATSSPTPISTPTPTDTPSPSPTPVPTTPPIVTGSANLRDGPGVEFRWVGEGQEGDRVEIVARFTNCRGELWYVIRLPPDASAKRWVFGELITGTIPSSLPTATPVPDEYTIWALMDAEKRAVLNEDIGLIDLIFAPEAQKGDAKTGQVWPARQRYRETFVTERHEDINHANIRVTFEGSDRAVATNDSYGAFVVESTGHRIPYDNYRGDEWTFEKNESGCWQITGLTYNVQVPCPYAQASDQQTIIAVINAEAEAVLAENLDIIREIFAPYAAITDGATGDTWSDPVQRYRQKFRREIHFEIIHENFRVNVSGNEATVTNDSRGAWAFEATPTQRTPYHSYGGDQWTLRKTGNGCWRIVSFTYNAL